MFGRWIELDGQSSYKYLIFLLDMLNHRNKMDTSIAIDVTTAMNMKSDRDTVISSYNSLVVSGGGDPPVGM